MTGPVELAIFAKAPVAGYAKTRLIPMLGPHGAAALHAALVGQTVAMAAASSLRPISLWCAPDTDHPLFASLHQAFDVILHRQVDGDLGARMLDAFEQLTAKGPAILIGTDCPTLSPELLQWCESSLRGGADAVFAPAEDGGYALVGLRKPSRRLFEDIAWGTNRVMSTSRDRLRELGWTLRETHLLWDIDTPDDYRRAQAEGLVLDVKASVNGPSK